MDNDPAVMAQKIDAAADNGVDHFIFDWYWYNETGGLFQDAALEEGFLRVRTPPSWPSRWPSSRADFSPL